MVLIEATVSIFGRNYPSLKMVDFLRDSYSFYFYLGDKTNISLSSTAQSSNIEVIRMGPPKDLVDSKKIGSGSDIESLELGGVKKGFYRCVFKTSEEGRFTGSFQTDPYPCPYS